VVMRDTEITKLPFLKMQVGFQPDSRLYLIVTTVVGLKSDLQVRPTLVVNIW